MNIARLSIKRPVFITSIFIFTISVGYISLTRLGVDIFPNVSFPFIVVSTIYPGAGPEEVEELISRPIEEELSTLPGIKHVTSRNQESFSLVIAEFSLDTDVRYAEQLVKNAIDKVKINFPEDAEEPLVSRFDPADQPVYILALKGNLPPAELYDVAYYEIKPRFEQIPNVGGVRILGGQKREIHIEVDKDKLNFYRLPLLLLAERIKNYGTNIPAGKIDLSQEELNFRTIGEFRSLKEIENATIFFGDLGSSIQIKDIATVRDGLEDKTTITYLYNKDEGISPAIFIQIYKQSGTNTVEVVHKVKKTIETLNQELKTKPGNLVLYQVRDGAKWIELNVEDVAIAIYIGIFLTIVIVYLFLGNFRSTIITAVAIPNSLLGAFILMYVADFTINVMTLLSLSLSIGLLIDDAIVVRENIFRHMEMGKPPVEAAEKGTMEVLLAVVATSATVIAVFLPIGFLTGIVGQFFKEFGLTVVFAMLISLFDAVTMAPMLSAYFGGHISEKKYLIIRYFERLQDWLDVQYERTIDFTLRHKIFVITIFLVVFILSLVSSLFVQKTFLPQFDSGEFLMTFELPPGSSLQATEKVALELYQKVSRHPEVQKLFITIGTNTGESNQAIIGVEMVPSTQRNLTTTEFKDLLREELQDYAKYRLQISDYNPVTGGVDYPYQLIFKGNDIVALDEYVRKLLPELQTIQDLTDFDTSYRPGKPEFQIKIDPQKAQLLGVVPALAGLELRYFVEGVKVAKFRENGNEYYVRLRLKPEQRNLQKYYETLYVPNLNFQPVKLSEISELKNTYAPANILRRDRSRIIEVNAQLAPGGALQSAEEKTREIIKKNPPPPGISYEFIGQTEDFKDLVKNIIVAFGLALLFIYLVLASLYESFIIPITILFAIPPAISGAFFSLLITGEMLNLFSMIGLILLMGLVTKNSILMVDRAMQNIREKGMTKDEAIKEAGMVRLRPILMTSFAMIGGMLPVALGLHGEISKSRTAMGIAVVGGLLFSTFVTVVLVPAIFSYFETLREKLSEFYAKIK
ncbi:MAG: efflux RND transporter permease subunit [Leptospiraceae bacterium]|nr:efflux RND transporter permease subunit [Leptospiraceae bacterium]MDW7975922.1 efflux RND transporter permease subunit [Leptospiraceae bacterium]